MVMWKQTLIGTSCNFQFYPGKSTSQPFQEVELDKGAPKSGDLCLFKLQSPKEQSFKPHVGVYCGNGEIIHLDAIPTGRASIWGGLQSLLGYLGYGGGGEGVVCKEDLGALRSSGHLLHVLRQCNDVKPEELEGRMQIAVNSKPPPYNDITSNCVHFALRLLGMDYGHRGSAAASLRLARTLMPRIWPQNFLVSPFICQIHGNLSSFLWSQKTNVS
uniref:uncharacterized protein LOC125400818 n=1 Tax=Myodes glareolus TaxID=447135 RepID=UPI002021F583|nr:uncharacterized protein LOC125400818 [Myodes glareolus]